MSKSKILLKITGSIAAYKSAYLASKLVQTGYDVKVVMSKSALEFVGSSTFEGLTGHPVSIETFEPGHAMEHIHLMRWADVIIVAPATAHFINRANHGIGDDLLTTLFLAHDFKKPYLIAPAMNTSMYLHPTTQASLNSLKKMGIEILETASGVLACGEVGWGKLLEPDLIFQEIENRVNKHTNLTIPQKVIGPRLSVLLTSGGTTEPIDAVRSITNTSTGKTGARVADLLTSLGFSVTHLASESSVKSVSAESVTTFSTFSDFERKLKDQLETRNFDVVIQMAAVSDYHIINSKPREKVASNEKLTLELGLNKKLLPEIKSWSKNKSSLVIGFKLTAYSNLEDRMAAAKKLFVDKSVDYVVLNELTEIGSDKHHYKIINSKLEIVSQGESKNQLGSAIAQLSIERKGQ